MTPEIEAILNGGGAPSIAFPQPQAASILARFCSGLLVDYTFRAKSRATLKRLTGVDEVWSMSFKQPPPGWRLVGRFLERNVFVGLGLYPRPDLDPFAQYTARAAEVIAAWNGLIGDQAPLTSSNGENYLGNMSYDVDTF